MAVQAESPAEEIKRLRRCISDLVSVLALPAAWTGSEPSRIMGNLLDALLSMLNLDFVYVRLKDATGPSPAEVVKISPRWASTPGPQEIGRRLQAWLGGDPQGSPPILGNIFGEGDIALVPLPLGLHGEMGIIVAGSQRSDFPHQTERLVLQVAANGAAIWLREASLLSEQRRVSSHLDQRVVQRTAELAASNEDLRKEIAERKSAEEKLRLEETELKRSQAYKAAILDSSLDCIVAIDHEGCITEFNPAAERTFGYRREDVLGKHLGDVIIPPSLREKHRSGFARHLATGESRVLGQRLEMTALCADGREIPVEITIVRILQDGPPSFTGYLRDITARKRSEYALLEAHANLARSEERWRSVFESSAIGVALTDLNGRFIATNPMFQKMLGYTEQEFAQLRFLDITVEEDRELNSALVAELLDGKRRQFQIEKQYRRKNGSLVWVRNNVSVVPGSEREPRFLMALSEDVTEQHASRAALLKAFDEIKKSETKLRQVIDTIPTMAWSAHPDGYYDFVSRRWLEVTGFSDTQALGWGWGASIHPDDVNGLVQYWQSCLASGTSVDTEARMRRFDGTYRWFLFRADPLLDESGKIVKWYGTNVDIEERKQAEEELRRKEEFLSKAQRLSLSGSFSWNLDTNEVTFSEEAYRIYGFQLGTPVTLERIVDAIHPDDRSLIAEKIGGARGPGGDQDYLIRVQTPDGSVKYLRGASEEIQDANGRRRYVGAFQDVTRRHLAEAALDKARSELTHVARATALSALTASIAHEVNQPLSGIVTNAGTCLRMLDASPPNVEGARETARRTIRDGNRASEVITRLRALFSKKSTPFEPFDLNEAAEEVIALSASELQRNRVILQQELAPDLPSVFGDRTQIQQVILNLVRNGSDAVSTVDDRPRELLIRTEREESGGLRLSVKDTGVGIEPEVEEKLFEAFYTTKDDGMGIGLSVSRSIMESHQGRLWASSNDGPGATFLFVIPCATNT